MEQRIRQNLSEPAQLEKLYRRNRLSFTREFSLIYPELKGNSLADFWYERLNYDREEINWGSGREMTFVLIATLIAGFIAKWPVLLSVDEEFFYPRNVGFIVFPALMAFFAWRNKASAARIAAICGLTVSAAVFINSLPDNDSSDTLVLSCIHLLLFLWTVLGFVFVGERINLAEYRLAFLKYSGDLVVMTTLILISGAIMTGLTIGLFSVIGFNIEKFYFENIVIFGLPAAPILGTYLIHANPSLVGKISPVIARIFSPLVLVMLLIYLVAIAASGKDPYNDREFLLIFNALLIGVMAIIFFTVSESPATAKSRTEIWIISLLSVVTIVVNCIALSAILFRISEWGFTPNRVAVLGANVLILINLLLVSGQLFRVLFRNSEIKGVGKAIACFLPVYCLWTVFVTFMLPFIFNFK